MTHYCGFFQEDDRFAADAAAYLLPIRRYVCPHGVSRIVGPPVEVRGYSGRVKGQRRACSYCAEPLTDQAERRIHARCTAKNRAALAESLDEGLKEVTTRAGRKRLATEAW